MRKCFLFLFGLLISLNLFSQQAEAEISIVYFNSSASYASGSEVSVHMDTKGIYDRENNTFSLYLQDENGNETLLSSVNAFYSPLLNGTLPEGLTAGNTYFLKVVASDGYISYDPPANPEIIPTSFNENYITYGEVSSELIDITIQNQSISSNLFVTSAISNSEIYFSCLTTNEVNPNLGSLVQPLGSTTASLGTSNAIVINSTSENFEISLIDIINGTYTLIDSSEIIDLGDGQQYLYNIPNNLPIGTYNFEIKETFSSNIDNIYSFSLLWHSNSPTLTAVSNNEICVSETFNFVINSAYQNGIGRNYFGSYYTIDWGDSSEIEYYTHAFILAYNNLFETQAIEIENNYFSHAFDAPSCNLEDLNIYTVRKELYNILDCQEYEINGGGASVDVNASDPPVADISHDDQYCLDPINQNELVILNNTSLGQYGNAGGSDCLDNATYTWQYQRPEDDADEWITILPIMSQYNWIQDDNDDNKPDLVVPFSALEGKPGCWSFRLQAVNGNGLQCDFSNLAEGTVEVLAIPDIDFNIQDLSGNTVEEICPGETVTLLNLTDALQFECQDLSFEWDINPTNPPEIENHCSFDPTTNPFSESPIVTFNEPGEYEITLTVTNGICEPQNFSYPFTVLGTPGVTLNTNGESAQVCLDSIDENNPYTIDFSQLYSPQYTAEPFAPNSYLWEISGDGISSNDYSFINNTSASSDFPVIEFYSFECYDISVSVDSECQTSASDSFNLSIDQNPIANFEILSSSGEVVGEICPGETVQLNDLSEISGDGCQDVTYQWGISALVPGTPADHCAPATGSTWTDPSPYVIFNEPGVYEISVQVTAGNCPIDTYTDTIVVEGPPSVNIDVNGESSDQICLNSVSNSQPHQIDFASQYIPTYSNDTGTNGDTYNAPSEYLWEIFESDGITYANVDSFSFVNGTSETNAYPTINFYSFGDYVITTTVTGDCGVSDSNDFAYSINEIPSITNPDSDFEQTICSSDLTDLIEFESSIENTTFSWSYTSADTYLSGYNSQTSNTGNLSPQQIFNSNNITGQITFQVTPSTQDCEGETRSITFMVNPKPTIDNVSEIICDGSSFSDVDPSNISGNIVPENTSYSWVIGEDSSDQISGGSNGTGSIISGAILENSTNTPQNLIYIVTPTDSDTGCIGDQFSITITVNPDPEVSNINDLEICNSDSISLDPSNISGNIIPVGTTYSWQAPTSTSVSVSGVSGSGDSFSTGIISNLTSTSATLTYTVTPTVTSTGCEGEDFTVTITVNPEPQIDNFTETICEGDTFTSIIPEDGTHGVVPSGTTYTWDIAANSSSSIEGASASTAASSTIPGSELTLVEGTTSPQDLIYIVTPTSSEGCEGEDFTVTITVNPTAQMNEVPDIVVCNGQVENIDFTTDNTGGITSYVWENTGGVDIGLSALSGTIEDTNPDLSFTAVNTGADAISTEITIYPTFENGNVTCTSASQTFTITVNPTTNVTAFDDQFIFTGDTTESVTIESVTENATFTWAAVAESGIEGLVNTSGSTNIIPAETLTLAEGVNTPLDVVYTITPSAPGDQVCPGNPYTYTVTVNPITGVTLVEDIVVCHGDDVNEIVFTSTTEGGITTYEWIASGDDVGLTQTDDGTGIINQFTAQNITSEPLISSITVTPTLTNGGVSSVGDPLTFTITVNPVPSIDNSLDNAICHNESYTYSPVNGQDGVVPVGTTYSWQAPTSTSVSVSGVSGSGDSFSTGIISNLTSTSATLTYTVTPTVTSTGCEGEDFTVTITVNPEPQIDNFTETICEGDTFTSIIPEDGTHGVVPSGTTYTWDIAANSSSSIEGASASTAASSTIPGSELTLVEGTTSPQDLIYIVTPTSSEGCEGEDFTVTITVNPTAQMNEVPDIVVCNGQVENIDFTTDNTGGITSYVWENTGGVDIGLSALSGTIEDTNPDLSFTAVNTGADAISTEITIYPTFENGNVTCTSASQTFTITVNPEPQIDNFTETICEGDTFTSIIPEDGTHGVVPSGTTYTWDIAANSSSSIEGASASTAASSTIPGSELTLVEGTTSPQDLIYIVTPTSSEGCEGEDFTVTITVNPTAQMNEVPDIVVCNGQVENIDFTTDNTGGITSYVWENTGGVDIGLSALSGTIEDTNPDLSFTAVNTGADAISTEITIYPTFENGNVTCTSASQTFTITVNPTTNVTAFDDQFIFTGDTTESVTIESVTENATFTWAAVAESGIEGLVNTSGSTNIIPAETLTLAEGVNTPLDVVYTITPSAPGDQVCPGNPYTYTVTVNPITGVTLVEDIVVCHGDDVNEIVFTSTTEGGITTYEWIASGDDVGLTQTDDGTGIINQFTAQNITSEPLISSITVTPTLTNGGVSSVGDPLTFTITVNPVPSIDNSLDNAICHNESYTYSPVNGQDGVVPVGTTYSWQAPTSTSVSVSGVSGSGDSFSTGIISNLTSTSATLTYTVTPTVTSTGCEGEDFTVTITVNPEPQIDNFTETICEGDTFTSIIPEDGTHGVVPSGTTYTWDIAANSSSSIEGASASTAASSTIPGSELTLVEGTTSPQDLIYIVTPTSSEGCEGEDFTVTITVNPTAQVDEPLDYEYCDGDTAEIDFTTSNGGDDSVTTYSWVVTGDDIGLPSQGNDNISELVTNSTNDILTATIEVTPTYTNAGESCLGPSETFTITVSPTAQVEGIDPIVVCNGDDIADIVFSTANENGTTIYSWTNDNTSIGLAASGTGDITTFEATAGTSPELATITVTPSYDAAEELSCPGDSITFTITVNPTAQVDEPLDYEYCDGDTAEIDFTTSNGGDDSVTTYSWVVTGDDIGLPSQGNDNISELVTNSTNDILTATIEVTPTYTNAGESCLGPSETFTITVSPTAQVEGIDPIVVCNGDDIADIVFSTANENGTTIYSWTNDNTSIGLAASGTGDITTFEADNDTNDPITANITVTPSYDAAEELSCPGDSITFTITVNPNFEMNEVSDIVVCNGDLVDEIIFSAQNTVGTTSYLWTNDNPSINLSSFGSSNINSFEAINETDSPVIATIVVTPTFSNGGVDCAPPTETFTITVNPTAQVDEPLDYEYCDGDTAEIDFTTSNGGDDSVTTYSWVVTGDDIGLPSQGNDNISELVTNSTNDILTATIEVTPTYTNAGESCLGPSETFTITVSPTAQVEGIDPIVVCNGDDIADIVFSTANENGTTIYSWTNDNTSIGLAASGTGDITTFEATAGTSPELATITVTPSYDAAEELSCPGDSITFTITVNPTAQVDEPLDYEYCDGDTAEIDFTTSNGGDDSVTTYSWVVTGDDIGLPSQGNDNISELVTNSTNDILTATIEVTPTYTNAGESCLGPSETFTITVSPTAQVEGIDPIVVCNGDDIADIVFSTANENGTTIYSWTNDNTSIGLAASGTGDITTFEADNDTNDPITANITVTPSYDAAEELSCPGDSITFTITVNPTAQVNEIEDIILCDGVESIPIEFDSNNSGGLTSYTWTNDNTDIGLASEGQNLINSFIPINTNDFPIEATIVVTPTFENSDIDCLGQPEEFKIIVNPSANVIQPSDLEICNGDQLIVNFESNNTDGTNILFIVFPNIEIGGGLSGVGDIDFTVLNSNSSAVIAEITVTPQFTNNGLSCDGPSKTFDVYVNGNVNDQPTFSDYNGSMISCFGANDAYIELNPFGGTPFDTAPAYLYNWSGPNEFTSSEQNIYNLIPGEYIVEITDSLGCEFIFEYIIEEPDPLGIQIDFEQDILCNGAKSGEIQITATGGVAPYNYAWSYSAFDSEDSIFFSDLEDLDNLNPGEYILIVNDINECGPVAQSFEITEPTPIVSTLDEQIDILCFGEATGSIEISVLGGTPEILSDGTEQYNYSWQGPNGFTSNDEDIFNLFAGEYILTVSDSYDCEFIFNYTLTEPDELIINYITTDNTCYESNDGSITLDIQGGVEPYQISWSNLGNGPVQTNLAAGIYEVTVIDAHDCEEVVNIEIIEAPIFDINPIQTNISCFGENDGSIILNIVGGVEPLTVTWDDDPTSGDERYNLGPGTYNVLIEDSSGNNCIIEQEFIIVEPQELVLNGVVTNPLDCDNVNSGSIDLQVVGGTEPYTFLWSNGAVTEDLNDIPAGNYSVSVTDFMGCEVLDQFELIRPSDLETNLIIDFTADCENGIPSQITTLEVSGGVPPYNIVWSDGDVSGDIGEIMTTSQNGTYVIDITDSLGCTDQILFDVDLFELGSPGFTYDSNGLMLCDSIGVNDLVQFTNTSTGDYTNLIWNFGDGTPLVEGVENPEHTYLYEGTYEITLTVEYPYGCSYTFSETIGVTEGYGLVLPNTFTPNGDGINDTIRPWYKCMSSIEVSIYDTFGSLLYVESSTGEIYGWDGLINGRPAENGNYIIVVRAVSLYGQEIELNGPVTLVR